MEKKVLKIVKQYNLIENGDKIVIGLSGGPDSMALLYSLLYIKNKIDFDIHIAHVNHGVRGKAALEDELFVEKLAGELNLPYYSKSVNMDEYAKEKGLSSEEAGRELRYGFFREILSKIGGGKIAVAHNKNDQAETLLMRFFRGTGIDGLKGMDYKVGNIIRPILSIDRDEIEAYLLKKNIETRLDKTNLETIYNRNKIRLELIPYIEKNYNSNIINTLWRTSRIANMDSEFLEEYTKRTYDKMIRKKSNDSIVLHGILFLKEHRSVQQRIIRNCILDINNNLQGFTEKHISDTLALFVEGSTGKSIDLIDNIISRVSYGDFIIEKKKELNFRDYKYEIDIGDNNYIKDLGYRIITKVVPANKINIKNRDRFIKCFDYDKIKGNIYIRNRKVGDRFIPYGMKGSKKIKDYFMDEKVPREDRNRIPLVTDDENILWVVGHRTSELYKITDDTKNILLIKFMDENEGLEGVDMKDVIKKILVTEEEIEKKVKELGEQITKDYEGKNLMLVGILKGAVIFMSELAKNIHMPVLMDFMAVSSYGKSSTSTGVVKIIKDLDYSIEDKDILIVEDIIDTGLTLSYLTDNLKKRGAKSVKIVTLLDKPDRRKADVPVDYRGFSIPDEFVVGYGLDYAEKYRNLPYVAALKEEVYS